MTQVKEKINGQPKTMVDTIQEMANVLREFGVTLGFTDKRSWYEKFAEDILYYWIREAVYLIALVPAVVILGVLDGLRDAFKN